MYLLVNLQSLFIGNICKALNFMKICTKTNFFTGIFWGRFLYCKYFLKLLYFWKSFGCFGACDITNIRIHYRHLRMKQGNVIFSNCIFDMFNSLGPSDMQATNNLFGGCISVWEKEDEEWYRHVFFGQYVVLFQKKMSIYVALHIFRISKGIWIRNMMEADIQKCSLK